MGTSKIAMVATDFAKLQAIATVNPNVSKSDQSVAHGAKILLKSRIYMALDVNCAYE